MDGIVIAEFGSWHAGGDERRRPEAYAMVGEEPGVFFRSRFDPISGVLYALFGNTVAAAHAMHGAIAPILNAVLRCDGRSRFGAPWASAASANPRRR